MPPPLSRDEFLEARVATLADLVLSTGCHPGCGYQALLPLRGLIARCGRLQLRAALSQLRCSRCKRRPARVTLLDHVVDGQLATFRIELLP
jgi:hypothetical protein